MYLLNIQLKNLIYMKLNKFFVVKKLVKYTNPCNDIC